MTAFHKAFIIFVVVCAVLIRLYHIEADPDKRISRDPGIFTDEGLYCLSARNLALFGEFNPNHNNQMVESIDFPLYTYTHYIFFKVFGITIKTLRLPSIIYTVFILFLTYFLVNNVCGRAPAYLAVVLLTFNFMFIQHNRLALTENLITLFVLSSLFFYLCKGPRKEYLFVSGIFFGCAIITKSSALFFIPAIALSIVFGNLEKHWWKYNLVPLSYFIAGIAAILILNWLYLYFITTQTNLIRINSDSMDINLTTINLLHKAKAFFHFGSLGEWFISLSQIFISRFSISMPVTFFLAVLYSLWCIATLRRPLSKLDKAELFLILWIFLQMFIISFIAYRPTRFWAPLIPGFCILSSIAIYKIYASPSSITTLLQNRYFLIFLTLIVALVICRTIRIISVLENLSLTHYHGVTAFVSIITGLLITVMLVRMEPFLYHLYSHIKKGTAVALLIISLGIDIYQYINWAGNQTYAIKNGNQTMKTLVASGMIGGQYAPILCFETNHVAFGLCCRNIPYLHKLGMTHYLDSVRYAPNYDYIAVKESFPLFLQDAQLLTEMPIGHIVVSLYAFK